MSYNMRNKNGDRKSRNQNVRVGRTLALKFFYGKPPSTIKRIAARRTLNRDGTTVWLGRPQNASQGACRHLAEKSCRYPNDTTSIPFLVTVTVGADASRQTATTGRKSKKTIIKRRVPKRVRCLKMRTENVKTKRKKQPDKWRRRPSVKGGTPRGKEEQRGHRDAIYRRAVVRRFIGTLIKQ